MESRGLEATQERQELAQSLQRQHALRSWIGEATLESYGWVDSRGSDSVEPDSASRFPGGSPPNPGPQSLYSSQFQPHPPTPDHGNQIHLLKEQSERKDALAIPEEMQRGPDVAPTAETQAFPDQDSQLQLALLE
jgi:hypothetical protein